ncbi:hypothetical protein KQ945_17745, partial [Bacillus subtilis subsp. subtilis]|nr:hypothetical protein [Bacillus subtilis subsp. subtilis]
MNEQMPLTVVGTRNGQSQLFPSTLYPALASYCGERPRDSNVVRTDGVARVTPKGEICRCCSAGN